MNKELENWGGVENVRNIGMPCVFNDLQTCNWGGGGGGGGGVN